MTYFFPNHALVAEISGHSSHELNLLFHRQAGDGSLHHTTQADLVSRNKRVVVHECEEAHYELAVHTIRHTAVAWNGVAKVFDLKGTLQARGKETAKRRNQRGESGEDHGVNLHGLHGHAEVRVWWKENELGQLICVWQEDWVRLAVEACEDVRTKILMKHQYIFILRQIVKSWYYLPLRDR